MTLSRSEEPFIEECFFLGVLPFGRRRLVRAHAHPRSQSRFRRWPPPARLTVVSLAAFASPSSRFRTMTSASRDPRSRVVETGASRARFFGSNGHRVVLPQRCCVSPVVPFDFCNEIVKRRVAFCGRDPRSPRRSVRRCSIESTVLPSTSRRPLRRRCDARVERRVVRSLRHDQRAGHPPHRTWGPARGCTLLEPFPRTT